jgi:hypothetical protein
MPAPFRPQIRVTREQERQAEKITAKEQLRAATTTAIWLNGFAQAVTTARAHGHAKAELESDPPKSDESLRPIPPLMPFGDGQARWGRSQDPAKSTRAADAENPLAYRDNSRFRASVY